MSKPNCISDICSLRGMFSTFLSSGDKSGFIQTGAWKEVILESAVLAAIMASVDCKNFIRIGLGYKASDLYFPSQKRSLIELACI